MNVQTYPADQARHVVPRVVEAGSRFSQIYRGLLASLGFALLFVSGPALAQVAPNLGVAQQFGVLGNSAVVGSAAPGTVVNGDVGSGPTGFAISNFPPSSTTPPFIVHNTGVQPDAVVLQAHTDANTAYTFLQAQGGSALPGGTPDQLSGRVLGPGVYSLGAGDLAASTNLTLNDPSGTGIFIFNLASTLTMNGSSTVTGTANPCNVYWRVGSSATLNGSSFMGTIIADTSITVSSASNVSGRLLAGAVTGTGVATLSVGGNTIGGCSLNAPLVIGAVAPTVSKSFSPTTITAGGTSTLTITLSNTSTDTADTITSLTDSLPSGMVIAATPNASTTCGGGVTAVAGTSTVALPAGGIIPVANLVTNTAGQCTVSVDVTSATAGSLTNTVLANGLVTNHGNNAAPANATLTVTSLTATGVPTLSEWAMIMLASLLAIVGFAAMRRQAR